MPKLIPGRVENAVEDAFRAGESDNAFEALEDWLGGALLTEDESELALLALGELKDGLQYNDEESEVEREHKETTIAALERKLIAVERR